MKYLLSLSILFFSFNFSAQCKGIAKACKKNLGSGYMPTGQSSNTELVPGAKYQFVATFYSGQNYRIFACSDSLLGDLQLTIRNTRRQLFYDNYGDGSTLFDFKVSSTQQLIITLRSQENKAVNEDQNTEEIKGCVAALVGYKN
ncbi:MAG: hypothetical protein CL851_03955 [Crocinitomicaceae bacterium]|nr:hypothetical protein [Crocinitomicaceae bacterium]PDH50043.1 MAG: hypothetical protein CND37_00335 [Bacteroidetes bacterium MED-G20]RPG81842.1 MAG: hypothetical protein CBC95_001440 [Crocinitomicaceae bacterium TMED135]|tara:strand:+ start:9858 stop:10289 length:432 start_codon:yes stop_codon:yes gene_type:complete